MMDWWRAHHGISNDVKLAIVASRAKARRCEVGWVWIILLDYASQNEPRGYITGLDNEQIAVMADLAEDQVSEIIGQLTQRGLIQQDGLVKAWLKRQPARERQDGTSTARSRQRRAKLVHAPPCTTNATPRNTTQHPEEKRLEEIRREKSKPSALLRIAGEIHERHPNEHGRRDIGVGGVVKKLEAIAKHKKLSGVDRIAEWENINANHANACRSEQWRKNDGEFAKSLVNWLAPTVERYEADSAPAPKPQPRLVF